jgi:flagellar assembly protein FliH
MSAQIIRQEQLTAYQRWELAALHEEQSGFSDASQNGMLQAQTMQTSAGYDAGYQTGYNAGRAAAEQQLTQLSKLCAATNQTLAVAEQQLAGEILDLAIALARQILRGELTARRDALLPVVREAISALPEASTQRKLLLHPSDVDIVRSHLGEDITLGGWQIVEDHLIEPGGCRIVAANGDVDATLATRWKRVVNSLNRSTAWHDE